MSVFGTKEKLPATFAPKPLEVRQSEGYAKAVQDFADLQAALRSSEEECRELRVALGTEKGLVMELQHQLDREKNRADTYASVVHRFVAHTQHVIGACNAMQREVSEASKLEPKKLAEAPKPVKTMEELSADMEKAVRDMAPGATP